MKFSEKLRLLRQSKELTQSEFSMRLNKKAKLLITRDQVAQWETDGNMPSWKTLVAICDYFGVTVDVMVRENITAPFKPYKQKLKMVA